MKDFYKGPKTQNVIDRYRPILKKSINDYIDELVKKKMTSIVNESGYVVTSSDTAQPAPTDLELDILFIVKNMLNDLVEMNDITYKVTESYFAILYKNNVRKWIVRVISNDSQITLIIPNENKKELKFKISTVDDINLYNKEITDVIKRYLSPVDNTEYIYTKWGKYIKPNPYKVTLTRPYPPVND